ncbi:MAG: ABC transporter ATP-binding protein [Anaerolineaceae bacterium]|nr:ABC transporter ATP-binding protein [Anaerolineaceae bacterium]
MTHIPDDNEYAVDMRDIVIRFPGVLANDHVNFTLKKGEIHALLGENGAGKSTLMNVLSGMYRPESGVITVKGKPVSFRSPRDAIAAGIGMVHQHFMLVPTLTVTENILLGLNEPKFFMNLSTYDKKIEKLQETFGLKVEPTAKIWQLSVGEQQRVEILKTLYRGADILILDEPTAVLAPQEIDELMETMRTLVSQGKSIIFISHKLNEVQEVSNRLTVLRKGKATAEGIDPQGLTRTQLAELMVGRKVIFQVDKQEREPGKVVLEVENLSADNNRGLPAVRDVSFQIREGEIFGVAGIAGNGQSELVEAVTGLRSSEGSIRINGTEVGNCSPRKSIRCGLAHIPEDRTGVGTAPNLSITKNAIMKSYIQDPISNGWRINYVAAHDHAKGLKENYDIQAPTVDTMARKLSGGNLQKLILAREISGAPQLIVAMQPTRGLDVGAIEGIQKLLLDQRQKGAAIMLISEELDELLMLSDRIAVIFDGELVGQMDAKEADLNQIGMMMTGTLRSDE